MTVLDDTREKPDCPCCGGTGMHEWRAHVTSSPDDEDIECSLCAGTGGSWFESRRNACSGYRDLMRGKR